MDVIHGNNTPNRIESVTNVRGGQMADEPTGVEPKVDNEATEDNERNSPAFKGVLQQLSDKNKALTGVQKQLDKIMSEQANASAAAAQADLESKGQYDTIVAAKDAEIEALKTRHAQDALDGALKVALLGAGANNEFFIDGVVSRFDGNNDTIAEYVATLKDDENNASNFGTPTAPMQGIPPAKGGAPAAKSSEKTEIEKLADGDTEAIKKRFNDLMGITPK